MRISDWSSDVCSSDLIEKQKTHDGHTCKPHSGRPISDAYSPFTFCCRPWRIGFGNVPQREKRTFKIKRESSKKHTTKIKEMRKERVYTDYRRWSDDALATLAGRTVEFMTDNTNFAEPQPALADYTLLVTDYRQKLEIARNRGSQVEVTAKNNARRALLRAMKQLGFYVNMIADGDAHILASSGLILINQPQAARIPYAPLYGSSEERRVGKECVRTCRFRWAR